MAAAGSEKEQLGGVLRAEDSSKGCRFEPGLYNVDQASQLQLSAVLAMRSRGRLAVEGRAAYHRAMQPSSNSYASPGDGTGSTIASDPIHIRITYFASTQLQACPLHARE